MVKRRSRRSVQETHHRGIPKSHARRSAHVFLLGPRLSVIAKRFYRAISSEADFLFFFKVVSIADCFRFNSATENFFWYFPISPYCFDSFWIRKLKAHVICWRNSLHGFSEGVPMIALYDVGWLMTKNSTTLVILRALTSRLITEGHGSFPWESHYWARTFCDFR